MKDNSTRGDAENESFHTNPALPWNRKRQYLRLLRLQPSIIYLYWTLFVWLGPLFFLSYVVCPTVIYHDLVNLLFIRGKFRLLPLEASLFAEFAFLASFIVLAIVNLIELIMIAQIGLPLQSLVLTLIFCLLIGSVSAIFLYLEIRNYINYRRYKRDYSKFKPIIVFTGAGNPVAVFPTIQTCDGVELDRLSMDSLEMTEADQGDW
ncbi:hypothetical protein F4777DRAFT_559816 [Nemania sp. FL0916]|nr:hypothetical protein F4777DRAFT_559816 [Nemania sp. FL0916]